MTRSPFRRTCSAVVSLTALLALAACGGSDTSDPAAGAAADSETATGVVRIAAASDLKFALDEMIATTIAQEHPEIEVEVTYGSSGTFVQQISNGAPFDLYLSADLALAEQLVDDGLADRDDLFSYAVGRLVIWTSEGSPVDPAPGLSALLDPAITTVAIANPEHAPYGRAAVAALETTGIYDQVQPKFVLGENIAQAAEFVASGSADAGIVAMSLVLSDPLRDVGTWTEVPLDDYPRLDQGGVVLSSATDPAAARAVREVMVSPAGAQLLERYGFFLPGS